VESNSTTIAEFAQALSEQVRDRASDGAHYSTEQECFAEAVLEMLGEAGVLEDPEVCVRAGNIERSPWEIAGWAFPPSEDEDLSQLSVLALQFGDSPTVLPVSAEDLRRRFRLACNFVDAMLAGHADLLEPAADAAALGRIIYERRRVLRKVSVHLATDGLTQRLKSIEPVMLGDIEISCTIWDIERLSRLSDPKQEEIEIDVLGLNGGAAIPCLRVPENDPHYDAYLCVVPGLMLARAYDEYGQRLLELNVRAFLSVTGKVNKGIRETIRICPDRFFPFNNGLALTARQVEVRQNASGHDEIVRILGLQIVNGGQTTASIHRAWKMDRATAEVERVFVQAKLTVITASEDEQFTDLVRSISKFANSQNAVKDDDLEANQPWHVAFEKLSRSVWTPSAQCQWYYERSRGSYSTSKLSASASPAKKRAFEQRFPRHQLITKTDLAKAWNAWSQRPEIVSLGGQKNFKQFMGSLDTQVRNPTLEESEYRRIVGKVILFREVTRHVNTLRSQIPAYRANVVAYLVAYLAHRLPGDLDFYNVWERQALPPAVANTILSWAEPVYREIARSAGGMNVTEWCKKPACWAAIRDLDLSFDDGCLEYVLAETVAPGDGVESADDANAVSEVLRLTPDDWKSVQEWVTRAEDLHYKMPGIVSTLARMAFKGWPKRPSVKQARAAFSVIERWRVDQDRSLADLR
jgi:hypothetical protein